MEQDTDPDLSRLQKALAAAGVASRRTCEAMIADGRVSVNGRVVRELGTRVDPKLDTLAVDGIPVGAAEPVKPVYIMLNKPIGYVSTVSDPHASKTVLDLLSQVEERVYPVGRLDADSSGLLLLTNDGDFANRLTHPRYHVPKIYRVRVRGFVGRDVAIRLSDGIDLPEGRTAPSDLRFVEYHEPTQSSVIDITLYEGRNRQVRRMMETVGHPVRELTRIAFGNLRLKGLLPGTWRKLRPEEVESLLSQARATPTPAREGRRDKRAYRPRNVAPRAVAMDREKPR
jgi:23S rRNA pseudouridine2605 synthase